MSKPIIIQWPATDAQAVCLSQTLGAAGNLAINGHLANTSVPAAYAEFLSLERKVSLTSAGDLHLISFTITGLLRGRVVSEIKAGPNATTIETAGLFTKVTSITANAAVASAISIGSGSTGNTIWLRSDYQRAVNNLTVAVDVITDNITYTFETSVGDPAILLGASIFPPIDGVTIPTLPAASDMIDATTSVVANYTWPTHSSRVRVSASDATGSLDFFFLQQGQV